MGGKRGKTAALKSNMSKEDRYRILLQELAKAPSTCDSIEDRAFCPRCILMEAVHWMELRHFGARQSAFDVLYQA